MTLYGSSSNHCCFNFSIFSNAVKSPVPPLWTSKDARLPTPPWVLNPDVSGRNTIPASSRHSIRLSMLSPSIPLNSRNSLKSDSKRSGRTTSQKRSKEPIADTINSNSAGVKNSSKHSIQVSGTSGVVSLPSITLLIVLLLLIIHEKSLSFLLYPSLYLSPLFPYALAFKAPLVPSSDATPPLPLLPMLRFPITLLLKLLLTFSHFILLILILLLVSLSFDLYFSS